MNVRDLNLFGLVRPTYVKVSKKVKHYGLIILESCIGTLLELDKLLDLVPLQEKNSLPIKNRGLS